MTFKNLKEYANLIIYISAILMLISILIPIVSHFNRGEQSHVLWLWGLIAETNWLSSPLGWVEDLSFYFSSNPIVLCIGLIYAATLFFFSIKNILIARNFRKDPKEEYISPWYNIFYGIIPILLIISWVFFISIIYSKIGFLGHYDFWAYFIPNFGLYGFIIGSSICTVGHVLQKYL